jgi:predicted ATPase
MTLCPALFATKGQASPEVERVYTRALQLCQQVGDTSQRFAVLRGLCMLYNVRPAYQMAYDQGEQLLALAQEQQDPILLLEAHRALGATLLYRGDVAAAQAHLERGIVLYNLQQHSSHALLIGVDSVVSCIVYSAVGLWLLGYPDQSLERMHQAVTLAQVSSHPLTLAWALNWAARFYQCRREVQIVCEHIEASLRICTEHGFAFYVAGGNIIQGWVWAMQGQASAGIVHIQQGLEAWRVAQAEAQVPYMLSLLIEAYEQDEQVEEGLAVLAKALGLVDKNEERVWEAELYRLKGELLLKQAVADEHQAETCFRQALDVARCQEAKSLELRVATGLSRLWQRRGKRSEAYQLLAPVYNWFTEGFDTADLQEARTLLEELA